MDSNSRGSLLRLQDLVTEDNEIAMLQSGLGEGLSIRLVDRPICILYGVMIPWWCLGYGKELQYKGIVFF